MAEEDGVILCGLGYFLFPSFVLQSVGLFTPKWESNDTCSSIGLVYSCCYGDDDTCAITNGVDELDQRALGLHVTAFAIMFLGVVGGCCMDTLKEINSNTIGWLCIMLHFVAGLLSFIGCIILLPTNEGAHLGYSFYLCLTPGCILILFLFMLGKRK